MKTITPEKLWEQQQQDGVELIDVRTPVEFREIHVDFARNMPLERLNPNTVMADRKGKSSEPVYLICKSGGRGQMACEKFQKAGFDNVVNVEGGTVACVEANLPVTRGKKAVSLERQVRIVAGFLVVVGVILGYTVTPWLFGLAGFVGAGLMFAGITNTCAMGMLIAKMPWNQVKSCDTQCSIPTGDAGATASQNTKQAEKIAG